MSFGFLTESALLPSKSKPIKVDGGSLVDLKAIVYAKEQKIKQEGSAAGSGGAGLRGLRGKRSASGGGEVTDVYGRKDVFARSNKGVKDRSQLDELQRVTQSKKQEAGERTLAAKAKLYEKMAKGELGDSRNGELVDFSRKTGTDLALLEAKAKMPSPPREASSKRKREKIREEEKSSRRKKDGSKAKGKRGGYGVSQEKTDSDEDDSGDDYDDVDDVFDDDPTSAQVSITDEFGRHRTVARGGAQHKAYLAAKKDEVERKVREKAAVEAYDERYSGRGNGMYRGNGGSTATVPGISSASGGVGAAGGGWAWSSGHGRGVDSGDFETREGAERRAAKDMAELLKREGGDGYGAAGEERGGKILSQWEKTLTGDQKAYLQEVHEETEAGRSSKTEKSARRNHRQDRKELLKRKQADRASKAAGLAKDKT